MAKEELRPFEVIRTTKIRDNRGEYVRRGQKALLNKATAEHYHRLGYIRVSMEDLYEQDANRDRAERNAASAAPSAEPEPVVPDSSVGGDDDSTPEPDAADDAGTGGDEKSARRPPVRRRARVAS